MSPDTNEEATKSPISDCLSMAFEALDRNKDGVIDRVEWAEAQERVKDQDQDQDQMPLELSVSPMSVPSSSPSAQF